MSIYDINGDPVGSVYDIDGLTSQAYDIEGNLLSNKPALTLLNSAQISTGQSPQGMATYGDYIFQFFSTANKIKVLNKTDYSLVNEMNCSAVGHGNNFQFGEEVQANGFPYLYVSDCDSADARYIYVLSIDTAQFTLVNTITLPSAVGYYPNAVIDFASSRIYVQGYSKSSYTDSTSKTIVSVLGLDDLSVIDSWQYDYLGVENGLVWDGNHIVLECDTWDGYDVKFYFINPLTKAIDETLVYEKEYDSEYEGFSFEQNYYLISKWIYKTISGSKKLYYEFYKLQ